MVNVQVVQRLVGQFEQTVVAMVFLDGPVGGAGLELSHQSHVGVEIAQGAAEHHVVDVQIRVEIARDAGEDHGVRLVSVDQMLRGGGDVDGAHAADGRGDVDGGALVGFEGAARHLDAGFLGDGDVAQCRCDIGDFLIHGADDGDCGHCTLPVLRAVLSVVLRDCDSRFPNFLQSRG